MSKYLQSYLPSSVVCHLKDAPPPLPATGLAEGLTRPLVQKYETVVIFADVSGYTAMCEAVASMGKGSEEHLAKNLNSYFEMLLKAMSSSGGDVFKFAGDAILVVWPPSDEDMPTKVRRAIQCGMNISSSFQDAQLAQGVRLSVKIGIGAGEVTILHLGGVYGRLEYLAIGDPLVQAFGSEHHATKTELIVSPHAWNMVSENFEAYRTPDGHAIITGRKGDQLRNVSVAKSSNTDFTGEGGFERLRSYIPGAVAPFAHQKDDKWIDEIREITVMFVNLGVGEDELVSMKSPAHFLRIHTILRAVQVAVYKFEGSLNKFLMDDKGSTLLAAFGLPPVAHENNALRCILAAKEVVNSLRDLGLRASCGVTTGAAFCGVVGGRGRREYSVLGDVVNLSARLMQYSKTSGSDITIDTATMEAASSAPNPFKPMFFTRIGEITVKGKSKPVVIWQPNVSKPDLKTLRTHFNKQDKSLDFLASSKAISETFKELCGDVYDQYCLEQDEKESSKCAIIQADKGFGQYSVAKAFIAEPCREGIPHRLPMHVFYHTSGNCFTNMKSGHIWEQLILQLMSEISNPRAWIRKEVKAAGIDDSLVCCLQEVLDLNFEGEDSVLALDKKKKLEHCSKLLIVVLRNLTKKVIPQNQKLGIVIDNAVHLDPFSWDFLNTVLDELCVFILILTVPLKKTNLGVFVQECPKGWLRLKEHPSTTFVKLKEHRPSSIHRDVVKRALGATNSNYALPFVLETLVTHKCRGNPWYAERLVQHFLREDLLKVDLNGCIHVKQQLCPLPDKTLYLRYMNPKSLRVPVPSELANLIASRIDRLSLVQRILLKVGAVLGDKFSVSVCWKVYPLSASDDEKKEAFAGLVELEFLSQTEDTAFFTDPLMRDVLLDHLPTGHQTALLNKIRPLLESFRVEIEDDTYATDGTEKKFPDSVIEGHLKKRKGGNFIRFAKKYVVVTKEKIMWFDPAKINAGEIVADPHKEMTLSLNITIHQHDKPCLFTVQLGEHREMVFEADSEEACEMWIKAIASLIADKRVDSEEYHGILASSSGLSTAGRTAGGSRGSISSAKSSAKSLNHRPSQSSTGKRLSALGAESLTYEMCVTGEAHKIYAESKLEGYLMKCGHGVKTWKKRYFLLMDGKVPYYETNQSIKKHKGEIVLTSKTVCKLAEDLEAKKWKASIPETKDAIFAAQFRPPSSATHFVVDPGDGGRIYTFAAPSLDAAHVWIDAITSEIQNLTNLKKDEVGSALRKMANHSVKEGYLNKKAKGFSSKWRRRYFCLFSDQMKYFTQHMGDPTGTFTIYRETDVVWPGENPNEFTVQPHKKDKKYMLQATSAEEAEAWVTTIKAQTLIAAPFDTKSK